MHLKTMKDTSKKFLNLHQSLSPLGNSSTGAETRSDKVLVSPTFDLLTEPLQVEMSSTLKMYFVISLANNDLRLKECFTRF